MTICPVLYIYMGLALLNGAKMSHWYKIFKPLQIFWFLMFWSKGTLKYINPKSAVVKLCLKPIKLRVFQKCPTCVMYVMHFKIKNKIASKSPLLFICSFSWTWRWINFYNVKSTIRNQLNLTKNVMDTGHRHAILKSKISNT